MPPVPAPRDPSRQRIAALLLACLALGLLASPLLAAYTGRGQPSVSREKVVLGYDSEITPTDGCVYRTDVVAADDDDIAALATATVPVLNVQGRTTVSLSALATLSTAVVVVTPAYEVYNPTTGNYNWEIGVDITLTATSSWTENSEFKCPKVYVDTDGHPRMRFLVKSLSTSAALHFMRVRVN